MKEDWFFTLKFWFIIIVALATIYISKANGMPYETFFIPASEITSQETFENIVEIHLAEFVLNSNSTGEVKIKFHFLMTGVLVEMFIEEVNDEGNNMQKMSETSRLHNLQLQSKNLQNRKMRQLPL